MSKTIVCIVSDDPIVNYLFIKEEFRSGDEVLLIASQYTKKKMKQLKNVLDVPSEAVRFLTLEKEIGAVIIQNFRIPLQYLSVLL